MPLRNRIEKECNTCKIVMSVIPSQIERKKTCSKTCFWEYQKSFTGESNSNWKGARLSREDDKCAYIKLGGSNQESIVDKEDWPKVKKHAWRVLNNHSSRGYQGNLYAIARSGGKTLLLHRLIMGANKNQQLDHINRNGLDNRKENLRFVTQSQNNLNSVRKTSRIYTGVGRVEYRYKGEKKFGKNWYSSIKDHKKSKFLGVFRTPEEASEAYQKEKSRILSLQKI